MKLFWFKKQSPKDKAPFVMPPTVIAAGIISALGEISEKRPQQAKTILLNMWLDVTPFLTPAIDKDPLGKHVPSILILEAYFGCSGDWKKMRAQMSTKGRLLSEPLEEKLANQIRDDFLRAAEKAK